MRPESLEYSYWDGASSLQNIAATVPDNVLGSARFAYFRPYSANVSGEPLKPMQKLCRIAGWALLVAIVVLSVVPPHYRPETPAPHDAEHFGIFFLAGLAFGFGYQRRHLIQAVLLVLFAAAVEVVQLAIPGRHSRLSDFVVDALSVSIGVGVAVLVAGRGDQPVA